MIDLSFVVLSQIGRHSRPDDSRLKGAAVSGCMGNNFIRMIEVKRRDVEEVQIQYL
jgi:hypothetical protein